MKTHADKKPENKSKTAASDSVQKQNSNEAAFHFVDNRPEAIARRKLHEDIDNSPQVKQLTAIREMIDNSPRTKQPRTLQALSGHGTKA